MATKPLVIPRWATVPTIDGTSGQPNIIEPSSGKKDVGFARRERPPRQDHNWLFNVNYQWQQYLEEVTDDLLTDLAAETAARIAADTTLQTNITTEATTRATADTTLQTNIDNEASTRSAADTALDGRLDEVESASVLLTGAIPEFTLSFNDSRIKIVNIEEDNAVALIYLSVLGTVTTSNRQSIIIPYLADFPGITAFGVQLSSIIGDVNGTQEVLTISSVTGPNRFQVKRLSAANFLIGDTVQIGGSCLGILNVP